MNTITIPVEVPADLEVKPGTDPGETKLYREGCATWFRPDSNLWTHVVMQQIAAAVEARKPRPPKFAVGDVVEWIGGRGTTITGTINAHVSDKALGAEYWINNDMYRRPEADLTLVRRAAK